MSPLVTSPPWLSCANSAFLLRARASARVRLVRVRARARARVRR